MIRVLHLDDYFLGIYFFKYQYQWGTQGIPMGESSRVYFLINSNLYKIFLQALFAVFIWGQHGDNMGTTL